VTTTTVIGFTGTADAALRFIYDRTRRIWPTAVAVTDDLESGRDVHGSALSCFAGVQRFTLYPDNPDAEDIQTFPLPPDTGEPRLIVLPDFDPKPHTKSNVVVIVDGYEISLTPVGISAVDLVARLAALPLWSHRARQEIIDFHPTDTPVNGDFWDTPNGWMAVVAGEVVGPLTSSSPLETVMPLDVATPSCEFTGDTSANLYKFNGPLTPMSSSEITDSIIFRADHLNNRLDLRSNGARYNNGPLLNAEDAHKAFIDIMTQIAGAPETPKATEAPEVSITPTDSADIVMRAPGDPVPEVVLQVTPTSFIYFGFIIEDAGAAYRAMARVIRIPQIPHA